MNNVKREVEQLLSKLSDDCSVEDIQYHLVLDSAAGRGRRSRQCHARGRISPQQMAYSYAINYRLQQYEIQIAAVIHGKRILQ